MSEERALSDIIWTPDNEAISSRAMSFPPPEVRSISWNNLLLSDEMFSGKWTTASEVRINPDTCIQSTVLLACARILSETISGMPLNVYRKTKDGHREYATECPLNKVLGFAPNEWQTKFEWLEQLVFTTCIWGNNYTLVKSGKYGAVSLLHHLHPSRMKVERLENGRLKYTYNDPEKGRMIPYTQDQIMHVRWTPEPDGVKGMMPIEIARDAIALARATEIYASKFWANMGRPGFVLQTDQALTAESAERLRDNWERLHRGVHNAWKTAVLTNGLKAEPMGSSNSDSQFLEVRRFQCEEICRVFRLPLALVQGQSQGGDLETQGQEFVTYTLMPWLKRIEQAISRSLIYDDDVYFAEFDTSDLMRGNSGQRASYLSSMLNLGLMTINEARKYEHLGSIGPDGDHHMVAMNLQPLSEAVKPKPEQPPPGAMPPGAPLGPDDGGPPKKEPDGPPSLSQVKTGVAPMKAVMGKPSPPKPVVVANRSFCATGPGGGIDNSCGAGSGGAPGVNVGKILEKIAANPDGFTLDRLTAEQPSDGIMVSEFPNDSKRSLTFDADKVETAETRDSLVSWLVNNLDVMDGRPDRYIGGWSEDNKFYLDVATRFPPDKAKEALEAGRAAGQLAVFNLGNFKETWVKYADDDSRKPKDWDKAFNKAKAKSAARDPGSDVELDDHGHHSVRSIVVDRLVSRGYTYTEASRLVEAAELQRIAEEIDHEQRAASGHSRQGFSHRGVSRLSSLGRSEGSREGQEARPLLVQRRAGRPSATLRTERRSYCPTGEGGGVDNSCSSNEPGQGGEGLKRGVDVMIGGGPRVVDIDKASAQRAIDDYKSHPKPEGFAHGSTTDLWSRDDIIRRESPRAPTKITSHGPMFSDSDMLHNNVGVSITAVGSYLSSRHQEERRDIGGGDTGPTHIIDTTKPLTNQQRGYVSAALTQDVLHAYERGLSPGFYSEDLKKAMSTMAMIHPELESDENARAIFTALTAITSNGANPDVNMQNAHDLYSMWKEHGTVIPSQAISGERSEAIGQSLEIFQSMLDSFGPDRTRRLLSGYAPVSRVNEVFRKLSAKSQNAEWREQHGSKEWILGDHKTDGRAIAEGSELEDAVVPLAAIFGPKIGAFYANLSGRHNFVTMDRWLMRSVGRVTGELVTRTSPGSASSQAESCLDAIAASSDRRMMFGSGLTRAQVIRSLKIQKKTGVIEENGAAYQWALAASKSFEKTPNGKIGKNGKPGGFGKTGDKITDTAHTVGNTLKKSLVDEQQDPRNAVARANIREVMSDIVASVEKRYPERKGLVDRDEVQAILWQYEKNLFKSLGAITKITENSLFSAAAEKVHAAETTGTKKRTLAPSKKNRRSEEQFEPIYAGDDEGQFDAEQWSWDSDLAQSGIDPVELFTEIEKLLDDDGTPPDDEDNGGDDDAPPMPTLGSTRRPLRAESRTYCPTGEGGGVDNSCGRGEQPSRTPSGKLKLSKEEKTKLKAKLRELPQEIPVGHEALVRTKPFVPAQGTKNSDFTKVPDDDSLKGAMGKNALAPADKTHFGMSISKGESYIGFHRDLPKGTPVAFRIDIPTFNNSSRKGAPVYAVTIHEDSGTGSKEVDGRIGHDGIARMTGRVQFKPDSLGALDIAGGAENKYPAATVKGKFDPSRDVPSDIDEWTAVGFDPEKSAYFYDKKTGQEVIGGTDAVSVGNTVFTRKPQYGPRNAKTHYRSLDEMMAVDSWGLESRAFCATGDGGGIDNSCNHASVSGGSVKPESLELHDAEASYRDEDDDYLYHATSAPNADKILEKGFTASKPTVKGGSYEAYSKGKVFFTEKSGLAVWKDKIENHLFHSHDDPPKVAVVRVKKSEVSHLLEPDEIGANDAGAGAYYIDLSGKKDKRSFCPTGSGNGIDNSCSTKEPAGSLGDSGDGRTDWHGEALKDNEPFAGASKFDRVTVSAGARVASALDSMGVDHGDAVEMASGGASGGTLFVRPAPEHGESAVLFDFSRDFQGVKDGIESSSILQDVGPPGSPELVLKQNVIDVKKPVAEDKQLRQAAGREFMRLMSSSVTKARELGVTKVVLNAAGNARNNEPGAWRGYTIWPRMGFDAPLPFHVRQKLPDTLSHCRSLLDLHATPEGTRWWRDVGGTDIDVQLDLRDQSSPQNQVFNRFLQHFSRDSRAMALGGGMDWLSPEDVTKIESMWEEIWDDESLDDYSSDEQDFSLIEEKHGDA